MRRASVPFLTIMAAAIATSAGAAAPQKAAKPAAQPALRAGSTGTATVTVKTVQKPALRTSTTVVVAAKKPAAKSAMHGPATKVVIRMPAAKVVMHAPAAKVVMHMPAAKPAPHKMAASHQPVHKRLAMHKASPVISVPLDEVRVVAFSQPVSTIYVGNPMVADVSMIDSKHAFVLGKGFGATNIVALDGDGKQVVNDAVNVYGHTGSIVILHRGIAQATYNCAGARCEIAPVPGDGKDTYAAGMEQMASHQEAGVKAAAAGR